jgi:hypothetical protein
VWSEQITCEGRREEGRKERKKERKERKGFACKHCSVAEFGNETE